MEDPTAHLLASVEALMAEVRGIRAELKEDQAARARLTEIRKTAAERQARSRLRHGTGGIAAEIRERIHARDGQKCLACGTGERLSIDHVVPRIKGGDDDVSNLQTLCIPCNAKKNGGDFRVTSVTQRDVTAEVVKEDLKKEQEKEPPASRNVTSVTQRPTSLTWKAYSDAYEKRHGVRPADGKSERGKLMRFIEKIPREEAPEIASFYLTHNDALYIRAKHPIDLLVRDAQKLRTEWKTGRTSTATGAGQQDKTQENLDGWNRVGEEMKRGLVRS